MPDAGMTNINAVLQYLKFRNTLNLDTSLVVIQMKCCQVLPYALVIKDNNIFVVDVELHPNSNFISSPTKSEPSGKATLHRAISLFNYLYL